MTKKERKTIKPGSHVVTWPVKLSLEEAQAIEPRILHYARGNRSTYIRAALLAFKPKGKL